MKRDVIVTMEAVAHAAGVSRATVSLALREHPRISAATRARVRAVAAQLGYQSDPTISRVMSYMRKRLKPTPAATIAYLIDEYPADWLQTYLGIMYRGARARAESLGYKMEVFALGAPQMTGERMTRILQTRGIEGVLVAPLLTAGGELMLDCSPFALVALGATLDTPALHRVQSDYYFNTLLLLRNLKRLGYRRIGLVTNEGLERISQGQEEGAFLSETRELEAHDRPMLCMPAQWQKEAFQAWFRRYRPEALITCWLEVIPALEALGLQVPRDVGVGLNWLPEKSGLSGVRQDFREIGVAAFDLLDAQLRSEERGIPLRPKTVLIRGTWEPGTTVRKIPAGQLRKVR